MNYHTKRARPITNREQEALDYIEGMLKANPNKKIFAFIRIKCATEDGFFDEMMKHAFDGFYTQNDNLRREVADLSTGLVMAELAIPKKKKQQKKFKETYKHSILRALKIARKFMNIDDVIAEYEDE